MNDQQRNGAVRVCAIADIECSRGCGTGACKREHPATAPNRDAELGAFVRRAVADLSDSPKSFLANVQRAIDDQAAAEQPAAAPSAEVVNVGPGPDDMEVELLASLPHGTKLYTHPAPAPADERAAWDRTRHALAVAMVGFADRPELIRRNLDAAVHVLDALTEPGSPLAWLRTARASSANETGAEGAKRGTLEQIQTERTLTCEAIDGAMAFGYQNTNPPPSDEHWLEPYWKIGRVMAESNAALMTLTEAAQAVEPVATIHVDGSFVHVVWKGEAPNLCALDVYAAPQPPAQADAREGLTDEQRDAIDFVIGWYEQSTIADNPYREHIAVLRALLEGANHA